jgi:hypothetical protein
MLQGYCQRGRRHPHDREGKQYGALRHLGLFTERQALNQRQFQTKIERGNGQAISEEQNRVLDSPEPSEEREKKSEGMICL